METLLKIETYQDRGGQHRWRMRAANGRIIAASSEGYRNREDMLAALQMVTAVETAGYELVDLTVTPVVTVEG